MLLILRARISLGFMKRRRKNSIHRRKKYFHEIELSPYCPFQDLTFLPRLNSHEFEILSSIFSIIFYRLLFLPSQSMALELALVSLFLVLVCLHRFVWKPWTLRNWYISNFKAQGYRVLASPFNPVSLSVLDYYDFSGKDGDSFKLIKQHYPHHDVAVFNIFNDIFLELIHPDLQQEFLSAEKLPFYAKRARERDGFGRVSGEGLVTSEGKAWKMKRKVLTEVFNFNFLQQHTEAIASICDQVLDEIEAETEGEQLEYDLTEFTTSMAGNIMFDCFFDQKLQTDRIEGVSPFSFLKQLANDVNVQNFDLVSMIFGTKFLNLGFRKKDR